MVVKAWLGLVTWLNIRETAVEAAIDPDALIDKFAFVELVTVQLILGLVELQLPETDRVEGKTTWMKLVLISAFWVVNLMV